MANLAKSELLFAFTSPRTFEKTVPEIELLVKDFSGQKWSGNSALQADFFNRLFDTDFYEGDVRPTDPAFAGRDRITRAPKALGFVDLEPVIALTPAGERLLSGKRLDETLTRQLMKFQLPSPYHTSKDERFAVKPYLELLRLTHELDGIAKHEIAIFFLQLTHWEKYEEVKQKILKFRAASKANKKNRKVFIEDCFNHEVTLIYAEQIKAKNFKTRESSDANLGSFLATKKSSMRDYADAFMRYLRATQLVTFNSRSTRLTLSKFKQDEAEFLLRTIPREPREFKSKAEFKTYLFASDNIELLTDNPKRLARHIKGVEAKISTPLPKPQSTNLEDLKDYLSALENQLKQENLVETTKNLKSYDQWPEIVEIFEKLKNKELPDASLYLEWNIWRTLTMLNYALKVQGNFKFDLDGAPLSVAGGNQPDIECEYDEFEMIVEVTLSSGNKQYEMEGEPVARHYGKIKALTDKPVFCLFVAPTISNGALAHFFGLNQLPNIKFYGGKTQIIPMSLATFLTFAQHGVEKGFANPKELHKFLQNMVDEIPNVEDENVWLEKIVQTSQQWL